MGDEVDLDWVGNFGGLFSFNRIAPAGTRDHRRGPIQPNANVAIYNTEAKRYLTYKRFDDTLAELTWTTTPAYEWQLHDQKGTTVASFALFNSRVGKYLVLQGKTRGTSLGWYKPPTTPQSFTVHLSAQPDHTGLGSVSGHLRPEPEGHSDERPKCERDRHADVCKARQFDHRLFKPERNGPCGAPRYDNGRPNEVCVRLSDPTVPDHFRCRPLEPGGAATGPTLSALYIVAVGPVAAAPGSVNARVCVNQLDIVAVLYSVLHHTGLASLILRVRYGFGLHNSPEP